MKVFRTYVCGNDADASAGKDGTKRAPQSPDGKDAGSEGTPHWQATSIGDEVGGSAAEVCTARPLQRLLRAED